MKMNSKKTLIGILITANILLPGILLAENGKDAKDNFCSRLSEFHSKVDQKITNLDTKLEEKINQILTRLGVRWNNRDTRLTEKKEKWDTNRNEHYAKLIERAKTEEQKQAVNKFIEKIEVAVAVRRTAVNAAIQTFRQGLEQARTTRQSSIRTAVSVFKNSVNSAFEKAESDCKKGVDKTAISKELKTSLKNARDKLTDDKQTIEKLGPVMSGLVTTKNQAIQKAFQDFKTVVEEARKELKVAFPEDKTGE